MALNQSEITKNKIFTTAQLNFVNDMLSPISYTAFKWWFNRAAVLSKQINVSTILTGFNTAISKRFASSSDLSTYNNNFRAREDWMAQARKILVNNKVIPSMEIEPTRSQYEDVFNLKYVSAGINISTNPAAKAASANPAAPPPAPPLPPAAPTTPAAADANTILRGQINRGELTYTDNGSGLGFIQAYLDGKFITLYPTATYKNPVTVLPKLPYIAPSTQASSAVVSNTTAAAVNTALSGIASGKPSSDPVTTVINNYGLEALNAAYIVIPQINAGKLSRWLTPQELEVIKVLTAATPGVYNAALDQNKRLPQFGVSPAQGQQSPSASNQAYLASIDPKNNYTLVEAQAAANRAANMTPTNQLKNLMLKVKSRSYPSYIDNNTLLQIKQVLGQADYDAATAHNANKQSLDYDAAAKRASLSRPRR